MPVQVNGMNVITRIAHPQAVALSLLDVKGGSDLRHRVRVGDSIDFPSIESLLRRVDFGKRHVERVIWIWHGI